ncbi:MAG: hypothetical protein P8J29_01420 [Rhodospirillales bacterium]|nr:hypothetical protein [Rhodospirillales bacterium]
MADVVPPPPTPPTVVSTPLPPQTAVAQDPPSSITSLPVGASLDGVVTSQLHQSTLVEIQTHLGKLLLQSTVSLGLDDQLHLILQKKSPHLQFIIKNNLATGTVNTQDHPSQSPQIGMHELPKSPAVGPGGASLPSANAAPTPVISPKISAEGQVKVDIGVIVRATLLTAPTSDGSGALSTEATSKSAPNGLLNAGDRVLQSLKTGLAKISRGNFAGAATINSAELPSTVIAGSKLDVRIMDILSAPDGSALSRSQVSLRPGQILQGTVTSHLPSGFPVTDTPIGRLVLETATHITTSSRLSMEIVSLPQATTPDPGLSVNALPPLLSRDLPVLTETMDFIQQLPPEVRGSIPFPAIPRTDSQLTSTLLFFLSALKGGNASTWLPDQTNAFLNAERPDLLGRLNDEFGQNARPFNEGTSGDWRTAIIPLFGGSYLENFQMSFRQGGSDDENKDSEEDARFIIDVTLSKFGRVQLDGLVISEKNKFDLFVRSEASFPQIMRKGINAIFSEFVEISGVRGNLVFQSQTHFVDVPRVQNVSREDAYLVI